MNGRSDEPGGFPLDRRDFLRLGGGALVTASLGGVYVGDALGATKVSEAPRLKALVKAGKLPPVAKRLPAKPAVIQPVDKLGRYGGTWHTGGVGPEDVGSWILQTVFYENVVAFRMPWKGSGSISDVTPNLAESFTFNRSGTVYTFKLRKGIRWSDGTPFTADDIVFAVNDIAVHKQISPVPSSRFTGRDGSPGRATKLDDYTVRLTFPTPNSLFLQGMCSAGGYVLHAPSKYLKQFHADYNPNANDLAKQANLADWVALFKAKNYPFDPGRPTVAGWKFTAPFGSGSQVVMTRNPYYWKVDPKGRQLPYIDRVIYAVDSDPEVLLAQALNGQLDMHARLINTPRNKPVLAASRKKGNYDFFEMQSSFMNQALIMLNQTVKDPVLREVFRNRNFRIGLSYAINRQEIIDSVYAGQGEPWQAAPVKTSPWYDEKMAKQYTQFSIQQANSFLDKAGYPLKNGARIGPDGKPISFVITTADDYPDAAQVLQFVARTWKQVGVEIQNQNVSEDLFFQRVTANSHDAAIWQGDGGDNPILYPYRYVPLASRASNFATLWALWYESNGKSGEAPPQFVKDWYALYNGLKGTTNANQQHNLMARILRGVRDQFLVLGTASVPPGYGIVRKNFHNVPKSIPGNLAFPNVAPTHPEQYFIA
jgi:peptide/nickel transport system substrate-binding protein